MFSQSNKILILVRHAKAVARDDWQGKDFDRPLSEFWQESARIIGQYLRIIGALPDMILFSPALRTAQTAEIIESRIGSTQSRACSHLWWLEDAPKKAYRSYVEVIGSQDDSIQSLLVIGHNPEISAVLDIFSRENAPVMKTGSVAILALDPGLSWSDIAENTTSLIHYSTPKFFHYHDDAENG